MNLREHALPTSLRRHQKRVAGRTAAAKTPLAIRAGSVAISDALDSYMRERMGRKFGKFAAHIERATLRFADVNGPRGGQDIDCSLKLVLSHAPSILVTKRGGDPREAFDITADAAERTLRRSLERRGWGAAPTRPSRKAKVPTSRRTKQPDGAKAKQPAGGAVVARKIKRTAPGATVLLEDSMTSAPSRKSTRRSANRSKRDGPQRLAEVSKTTSPRAAASRARAQRRS